MERIPAIKKPLVVVSLTLGNKSHILWQELQEYLKGEHQLPNRAKRELTTICLEQHQKITYLLAILPSPHPI